MGTKITALPQVVTPQGTDELAISQDIGLGGRNTYKATLDQIRNYVKNSGGGTGSVTSVSVSSNDGSIGVFGSPITSSGTILVTVSSVGLDKLDDGGATGGEILTYNGSTKTWEPGYGEDTTPIGTITWFAASAVPTSYLECSGGVVDISDYTDLYYVIGTKYNTGGEVAGKFRLPDLRGEFIRGWDHGRGVDSDRIFGSNQKGTITVWDQERDNTWSITTPDNILGEQTQVIVGADDYSILDYNGVRIRNGSGSGGNSDLKGDYSNSGAFTGITRPRNVALLPCIKALKTITGTVNTLNFIEKPPSPTGGKVLTYDGSTNTWVASGLPSGVPANITSAKAWVCFNGIRTGTGSLTIYSSYNVSSVTKTETACYTINFQNAMTDENYAFAGSAKGVSNEHTPSVSRRSTVTHPPHSTTQLHIMVGEVDNNTDTDYVSVIVFGN